MTGRLRRLAALPVVVAMVVAACGSSVVSPSTSAETSLDPSPPTDRPAESPAEETPIVVTPQPTAVIQEGQTDTDWGRIWDSLPSGFPRYPGSTISEEAATGPASATLVVDGNDPDAIAKWWQHELEVAAFSTEAMSGPLEDGSFVIDSVGQDLGCRLSVSIAPLGGVTFLTILYGAGCPHD